MEHGSYERSRYRHCSFDALNSLSRPSRAVIIQRAFQLSSFIIHSTTSRMFVSVQVYRTYRDGKSVMQFLETDQPGNYGSFLEKRWICSPVTSDAIHMGIAYSALLLQVQLRVVLGLMSPGVVTSRRHLNGLAEPSHYTAMVLVVYNPSLSIFRQLSYNLRISLTSYATELFDLYVNKKTFQVQHNMNQLFGQIPWQSKTKKRKTGSAVKSAMNANGHQHPAEVYFPVTVTLA
ncbi:hypothetical protein CBL_05567 [Carabus blaptoides fortunei]